MLNTCNKNHEEISYTAHYCPICTIYNKIDSIADDLEYLIQEVKRIEGLCSSQNTNQKI